MVNYTRFRKARKARNWTQEGLEIISGVSQSSISKIESGSRRFPELERKLAAVLGIL